MAATDTTPPPQLPTSLTGDELAVLRDALTGRPAPLALARALEAAADARGSHALRMLGIAFVYDLIDPSHEDRRVTAGGPYATMFETEEGTYPPRVGDVIPEVSALWRWVVDEAGADPIVAARLNDLLYVAEGPSGHERGRGAARALLQISQLSAWEPVDRADALSRALEIARELNDKRLLADAVATAEPLLDELLGQEHPGPPFAVTRALLALKPKQRPGDLNDILDRQIARFDGGPHAEAALALAARGASTDDRRKELQRRRLDLRIGQARAAEGLTKVFAYQRAIELATQLGFGSDANQLLTELQDIPHEDLGFESFSESVALPVDDIKAEVDRIAGSDAANLADALDRIGIYGPPGGSDDDIDRELDDERKEFPLLGLFSQTAIGGETSVPSFIADDEQSKRRLARGQRRTMHANFFGQVLYGPMLDRAPAVHGRPSHDDLAAHFSTRVIGPERGERIARALELFWDGHFDDSAHVLVPRLEAILRDVARGEGIAIAKPVRPGEFGGVVTLGTVMRKLRELYDDAPWLAYLEALLCDPLSLNLRNDLAHGLAGTVGGVPAALLLQAACYLAAVTR